MIVFLSKQWKPSSRKLLHAFSLPRPGPKNHCFQIYQERMPPLGPTLYIMAAKALGYLLQNRMVLVQIRSIPLPAHDDGQLVNRHFADNSFLTILEDKETLDNTMNCLQIFCKPSGSTPQTAKPPCFCLSQRETPHWLMGQGWTWFQSGQVFKFMGIPLPFMPLPQGALGCIIAKSGQEH